MKVFYRHIKQYFVIKVDLRIGRVNIDFITLSLLHIRFNIKVRGYL